ncbi:MAG: hypothetical protein H6719_17500 [Sandaracinaceae bacterium]|nr:hypothetical protein [Sandaracinaceae bacterium]
MSSGSQLTRAVGALGAVFALLAPSAALGQDLHLVLEGVADPAALGEALAEDLGRPVSVTDEVPPVLRVTVVGDGTAVLRYTDEDGAVRERTAELTADPEAALRELALLGSNLVRDQASALIADAVVEAPVAAVPDPPTPVEPVVVEPTVVLPEPESFALAHPLRLGMEAIFGLQVRDPSVEPLFDWGLSIFGTVHEALAIGLTRVNVSGGYSSIEGSLFALSGAPAVEGFLFPDRYVQLYGQVGVSLQGRTPTNLRVGEFQAAPFLAAGARFWIAPWFTLGVQLAVHVTLTDGFRMGGLDLPQWSTPGTLGLSAEFHIDP